MDGGLSTVESESSRVGVVSAGHEVEEVKGSRDPSLSLSGGVETRSPVSYSVIGIMSVSGTVCRKLRGTHVSQRYLR